MKCELSWPNCGDDTLRVLGVLNCFKDVLGNLVYSLGLNSWRRCSSAHEHVDDSESAAMRFLDEDRSFDRQQAVDGERSVPHCLPQFHQLSVVFADFHTRGSVTENSAPKLGLRP